MRNYLYLSLLCLALFTACSKDNSNSASRGLYRILVGEEYGFMNSEGKIVIEPQYDKAFVLFSSGVCYVEVGDKRYLIDERGDIKGEIVDSISSVYNFVDGLAIINSNLSWGEDISFRASGIINSDCELIVPAIHFSTYINEDGEDTYICVRKTDDKWFMTDLKGQMIGFECDSILSGFVNGLCAIKKGKKWGYMDNQGNLVIDTIYDFARVFSNDGLARVRKGDQHMFIDKEGKCILTVDSTISGFTDNRAAVIMNGEKCLIDKSGNIICNLNCESFYGFNDDGLATIEQDGKYGKIDSLGKVVISAKYENLGVFRNDLAYARLNGKWGLIDRNGKEVVHPIYYYSYSNPNDDNIFIFSDKLSEDIYVFYYYDGEGKLIWQDLPQVTVECPRFYPTRKDFIEYFDANASNLDPIEGIYYVTDKNYYQDRDNPNSYGLNSTNSEFYAVARVNPGENEFWSFCIDGTNRAWVNKFVKIGNSNNYAIVKRSEDTNYSSEGKVTLEDPNSFDFRLETGKNNWYNFFVLYEFIRDYPAVEDMEQYQRAEWFGTGFAIADGYVVTNNHVTKGAKTIRVKGINGDMEKSYKGYVLTSDKEHDLSVIKIVDSDFESFGKIPYTIGKAAVDVGDDIFVLGYPLTSSMGKEVKLTDGIISSSTGYKGDEAMYQISAPIQPGNSGGPLFNEDGDVVGVVCAKHAEAENANYAIKISYLYSMLDASGCNLEMANNNSVHGKKLSSKVKKIKDFVYLIECSSK